MTKTTPRTLSDFKSAHDKDVIIPAKIQAAIDSLAKVGPEHHVYEAELVALAGVAQTDFGKYRSQFEKHIVTINHEGGRARSPKNVYFHDKKLAARLRGE